MSSETKLKNIVEAALLAAGKPLSTDALLSLFLDEEQPDRKELREVLDELQQEYAGRGIEVTEVNSGWRIQVRKDYAPWASRLWDEKPARYSRALLETLALIAYRQPITRGEIEEIRGVAVSTNIVKTLLEREWVRVVGQRDVPGKPSLYATTRQFLDYFNLKGLDDLPTLAEIKDLEELNRKLDLPDPDQTEALPQAAIASTEELVDLGIDEEGADDEAEVSVVADDSDVSVNESDEVELIPDAEAEEEISAESAQDEIDQEEATVTEDEMIIDEQQVAGKKSHGG